MPFEGRLRDAFLAVAKHGSIGRAADALNMSQPTLSRMLKRFEQRVGVPLFDRFASGVALNIYGEALLPFARRIETESQRAMEEIARLRDGTAGVLRIGSAVSIGIAFLPPIFRQLTAENPQLRIELIEGLQDVVEPALLNRRVDIVIGFELPENDDIERLDLSFADHGSVIAGVDHPACRLGPLTMADLTGFPWVLPPEGTQPRRGLERVLASCGAVAPHITVETWSVSMMKALILNSGFLSWLPHPLYAMEEEAGLIGELQVEGMTVPRRTWIYRRRHGLVPPAVRRFLEIARAQQQ